VFHERLEVGHIDRHEVRARTNGVGRNQGIGFQRAATTGGVEQFRAEIGVRFHDRLNPAGYEGMRHFGLAVSQRPHQIFVPDHRTHGRHFTVQHSPYDGMVFACPLRQRDQRIRIEMDHGALATRRLSSA
jgi:hypothetical protein